MKDQIDPKSATLSPSARTSPAELTERSGDLVRRGLQLLASLDDRATHEGLTKTDLTDVPALSPSQTEYVCLPDLIEAGQVRRLKRGRHLATLTSNVGVSVEAFAGGATVREARDTRCEWEIDCPVSSRCTALDPDALWLALGTFRLAVWDLPNRVISHIHEVERYLHQSRGGKYLFEVGPESVRAWRMPEFGESLRSTPRPSPPGVIEHFHWQSEVAVPAATDPTDSLLATAFCGRLRIWDLATGTLVAEVSSLARDPWGLWFSSNSAHLIAAHARFTAVDGVCGAPSLSFQAWRTDGLLKGNHPSRERGTTAGTDAAVASLVEEEDCGSLASEWPTANNAHPACEEAGGTDNISVVTSADGRVEARLDSGFELAVFATDTMKELSRFGSPASDNVVLSQDGRIVVFDWDPKGVCPAEVVLADTASGKVLQRLAWPLRGFREPATDEPHEDWESDAECEHEVMGFALSPDSGTLAIAFRYWLFLWDVNKRRVVLQHKADCSSGARFAFSASGQICAYEAGREVGAIRLDLKLHWGSLAVHDQSAIAVNGDGSLAAVGFSDGKVAVYSLPEFAVQRSYPRGHVSQIVRLSFSDERATITSECEDGVAREWSLGAA